MKTLIFENISKTFQDGSQTITALKSTNFSIEEGEFVAIIGPSGSGKSTFDLGRWFTNTYNGSCFNQSIGLF